MELRPDNKSQSDHVIEIDLDEITKNGVDLNDPATLRNLHGPGVTLPEFISPADIRRKAEEKSSKIFASYNMLQEILMRHEATIHKRWAKKTKQQRLKILLTAWPKMSPVHRPDFAAFRKETVQKHDAGTKYRDYFMFPYINQEDLSKPKPLFLLLNAGGPHHPSRFAAADIKAMRLEKVTYAIVPRHLGHYTMLLNGVSNTHDYGKLLAWASDPDNFELLWDCKQFMPGDGLLILEVQERPLAFLVQCCQELLHDIPAAALTSSHFPIHPEPQLKHESETCGFESLAAMAAAAPYRLPGQLVLDEIESLVAARASAAEDHLWSLRDDPSYFAEKLFEIKEHRYEILLDLHGNVHPVTMIGCQDILWARIVCTVIRGAYWDLEISAKLRRQLKSYNYCRKSTLQSYHLLKTYPMSISTLFSSSAISLVTHPRDLQISSRGPLRLHLIAKILCS